MKFEFDTATKKIKVLGEVSLSELYDELEKFFPNGKWKEYSLETGAGQTMFIPYYPYVPPLQVFPYNPIEPMYDPPYKITCNAAAPQFTGTRFEIKASAAGNYIN